MCFHQRSDFLRILAAVLILFPAFSMSANEASVSNTNAGLSEQNTHGIAATKVTLATDNAYPPFSYVENDQVKGLYIDLVRAVDAALPEFEIDFVANTWSQAKSQVKRGEYLGLLGPYFHAHDWPEIYPYSYPIFHETLVIVCKQNANTSRLKSWPVDYAGMIIGTVAGYDGWQDVRTDERNTSTVNFFEFPNVELALLAVHKDIVGCTVFEKTTFAQTVDNLLQASKIEDAASFTITQELTKHGIHIGYSEQASLSGDFTHAYAFQKAFDAAFFTLLQSGELEDIYRRYGVEYR